MSPAASHLDAHVDRLQRGQHLDHAGAEALAEAIVGGALDEERTGAALLALRAKGESPGEILAFARALLQRAISPPGLDHLRDRPVLDIVGTGGDGSGSLNISTAAALVTGAAGRGRLVVVKHGNRAVSGRCGSADVLGALGLPVPIPDARLAACVDAANFAFLFAPRHHPALAALAPLRRRLGVRTIFNLLGPLVNPARPSHALIGACSLADARTLGGALVELHAHRCLAVVSTNGWDEATPICPFHTFEHARGGRPASPTGPTPGPAHSPQVGVPTPAIERSAADFDLPPCDAAALAGGDAAHNAGAIHRMLAGERSPFRDAVVLNAALALLTAGVESDPRVAAARAAEAIDSGAARDALQRLLTAAGGGRS